MTTNMPILNLTSTNSPRKTWVPFAGSRKPDSLIERFQDCFRNMPSYNYATRPAFDEFIRREQ